MKWSWCLVKDDATLATGWQQIGDFWYFLEGNGSMKTGFLNNSYYLNDLENSDIPVGAMVTGWFNSDNKWYYFETESNGNKGLMYKNGTYTIGGKDYTFDDKGIWIEDTNLLSDKGADFIGSWEGFWSQAKYDPYYPNDKRYITIGYGTTYESIPGIFNMDNPLNTTCTVEQAREWLEREAQECAKAIKSDLNSKDVSLRQNKLDALISFAYNCGTNALLNSTLYKNICNGVTDSDVITSNFQAWSNSNGKRSEGLYKRRTSEAALYLNADYTGNN